jgi:HK97 family phage prohead protease
MDRTIADFPHVIHRSATVDVENAEERSVRFVASDETVDRYGDVIMADGWQLAQFRKNPVFLWMHSHAAPIGTVPDVKVEGTQLIARAKFAPTGVSELADSLWAMVKSKVLRAVSVGFTVESEKDYEPIRDDSDHITGFRYLRQELLELSLVSVPANPNALALARSLKISEPLIRTALPLDASVIARQAEARRRIQALRLRGHQVSAPR